MQYGINATGTWCLTPVGQLRCLIRCTSEPSSWNKKGRFTHPLPCSLVKGTNGANSLYFGSCAWMSAGSFQGCPALADQRGPEQRGRRGEASTVSLYFCGAGGSLRETGCHCSGWSKSQGQGNVQACLRSICRARRTVVQVSYCSSLEGAIHILTAASYFPAPYTRSQLRFCLKELSLLKKKIQNPPPMKPFKAIVLKSFGGPVERTNWRVDGKIKVQILVADQRFLDGSRT